MVKANPDFSPPEPNDPDITTDELAERMANWIAALSGLGKDIKAEHLLPWLFAAQDREKP